MGREGGRGGEQGVEGGGKGYEYWHPTHINDDLLSHNDQAADIYSELLML